MSIHNILVPNNLEIYAKSITSDTFNADEINIDDINVGNLNITSNLQMNGSSGSVGQVLRKTSPTTQAWQQLQATDLTPGAANNTLVTNAAGTAAQWSNSIRPNSIIFQPSGATFDSFLRVRLNNQTITYDGFTVTSTNTKSFQKTQQVVSMTMSGFLFDVITSGGVFTSLGNDVPLDYRPATDVSFCVPIYNSGAKGIGKLTVSSAGKITLTPYSSVGFTGGDGGTDGDINVTWSIPN